MMNRKKWHKTSFIFLFTFLLALFNPWNLSGNAGSNMLILQEEPEKVYVSVEKMPEFEGGSKALDEYVKNNLIYPEIAEELEIEGRVIVRFVVDKKGNLKDAQILRSLHKDCDAEVLRLIEGMPKWIPGEQDGKEVAVYFTMPVVFRLPR